MKTAGAVLLLALGAPAMAQEAPAWRGAADCRLAAVKPQPATTPSWNGGCKAGFADGKGVLEWDDAKNKHYKMEAEFAAGRVRGEVTLRYPDRTVYKGPLTNGVPDGVGYFRFADGDQYEGDVRMDELTGSAEVLYANGDDYKGGFKKGKRDGVGVLTWVLGGRYEGGRAGWARAGTSGRHPGVRRRLRRQTRLRDARLDAPRRCGDGHPRAAQQGIPRPLAGGTGAGQKFRLCSRYFGNSRA